MQLLWWLWDLIIVYLHVSIFSQFATQLEFHISGGGGGQNAQISDSPKDNISDITRWQKSDIWLKKSDISYHTPQKNQLSDITPLKNKISDIQVPPFHPPPPSVIL